MSGTSNYDLASRAVFTRGNQMGYRAPGSHVVAEEIEGEVLIVNLATGLYFSLLHSATDVWRCILAGADRDQIVAALTALYGAPASEVDPVVDDTIGVLVERELIVEDPAVRVEGDLGLEG